MCELYRGQNQEITCSRLRGTARAYDHKFFGTSLTEHSWLASWLSWMLTGGMTVKAPADLRPGRYEWRLEFAAENAAAVSLTVRLTVHPLRLPSLDDHAIALIEEDNQVEFKFCREIGCTTAVMPFTWPSYSSFVTDDTGNVIGFNAVDGRFREWMEKWFSLYNGAGFPSQYPLVRLQAFASTYDCWRRPSPDRPAARHGKTPIASSA